jgi:hypothetical protein
LFSYKQPEDCIIVSYQQPEDHITMQRYKIILNHDCYLGFNWQLAPDLGSAPSDFATGKALNLRQKQWQQRPKLYTQPITGISFSDWKKLFL